MSNCAECAELERRADLIVQKGAKPMDEHWNKYPTTSRYRDWPVKLVGWAVDVENRHKSPLVRFGNYCECLVELQVPPGEAVHHGYHGVTPGVPSPYINSAWLRLARDRIAASESS
jgi:hypothetical protein